MAVTARVNSDRVIAECLPSDGIGAMVYKTGVQPDDDKYVVASCDPSDVDKMPAFGMLIEKLDSTTGIVQRRGIVRAVYSGLTPGELLFVDDAGGLSNSPPEPTVGSPHKFMQSVGVALSGSAIDLDPNFSMARRRY